MAVSAADREHARVHREPLQEDARSSRGQHQRAQGRLQLRRDDRDVRELVRSAGGANRAGTVSQYHGQQRDRARLRGGGGEVGTSAVPRLVSDHARQRRSARTRRLQEFSGLYFPGRGRDRRRMRRDWRVVRRRDRDHHDLGPRHEPQGRGGRTRGEGRAADGDHRHPARGPVDRHADQARAGRPAAGDVRTPRRVADSDYRGVDAGRLLRLRVRGGANRGQVHDAGDPAHRRPARQRRGAVAAARRRRSLPPIKVEFATNPKASCRTRATRDAFASVGGSRDPGPRASRRRTLEREPDRQHQLLAGQQRADGADARAQDRGHRARDSADRGLRRRERRRPGRARMGLDLRADSRGRQAGAREGQEGLAHPSALSESAAARPRRHAQASSRS